MTKRSESYWIRLTPEELADWRRRAAALSISVAELLRLRMGQPDPESASYKRAEKIAADEMRRLDQRNEDRR